MIRLCLSYYPNKEYTIDELVDLFSSKDFIKKVSLPTHILHLVLREFKVTKEEIESTVRKREYVDARKVFSYLATKHSIGSNFILGSMIKKDHATVNVSISWIQRNVIGNKYYSEMNARMNRIEYELLKLK